MPTPVLCDAVQPVTRENCEALMPPSVLAVPLLVAMQPETRALSVTLMPTPLLLSHVQLVIRAWPPAWMPCQPLPLIVTLSTRTFEAYCRARPRPPHPFTEPFFTVMSVRPL